MASVLALFYPLPLSKFQLRSTEPELVIIQGNSILAENASIYSETQSLADLIDYKANLELENTIIKEIGKYDWNKNIILAIAKCESGFNPMAFNPETRAKQLGITQYSSYGVFQLNRPFDEKLYDYEYNIAEAYKLYQKRGYQPWTCFSKKYN